MKGIRKEENYNFYKPLKQNKTIIMKNINEIKKEILKIIKDTDYRVLIYHKDAKMEEFIHDK